ncbi:MAG: hypothetical protein H6730_16395 [Deltaproteobacteria bacterium]|nr:hypothetical protein [Deltaproteobacteria bacterium]
MLLDLSSAPDLPRLELPPDPDGHLFVMDGHGQRLLDAHKARGQLLSLVVPPDPALLVWFGPTPWGRDEAGTLRPLADPEARPPVSARGPVADELREHLFLRPLTPEFVAGLDAAVSFRAVPELSAAVGRQPGLRPLSVGLLAGGGAALAVGAVAAVVFAKARAAASPAVYTAENAESVRAARDRAELSRAVMVGGLAAGGVAVGAALLYELVGGGS